MPPPSLLDLITAVDNVPLDFAANHDPFIPLHLSPSLSRPHGYVHPRTVASLPWPSSFVITSSAVTIVAAPDGVSFTEHVNAALQEAVDAAIRCDAFPMLRGHSEHFRILGAGDAPDDIVQVERFAASLFGIATRGAHCTAYTRAPDGQLEGIWVARRSSHLFSYPGKLDSTVAGGVKSTDTPTGCILAEAQEEASLPEPLVTPLLRSVGVLTLANRSRATDLFHSEILYVYDMELAAHHGSLLKPGDDEVEEFVLMGVDEVRRRMAAGEFKPNVCPVLIDFLVRHGVVTPETEGEGPYVRICSRLRRQLPVPLALDEVA